MVLNKTTFLLNKTAVFQRIRSENPYKISEMINVHILCSNCPPPTATHAQSLSPLQLHYQLCPGPVCPIPQQSGNF